MEYKVYKLTFPNGLHVGRGGLSTSDMIVHSDTLFSALCIEALAIGGREKLDKLVGYARSGQLIISDAMPYVGNTMYIPKPMCRIVRTDTDQALKKAFKKLSYIPWKMLDEYLSGKTDPETINDGFKRLGKHMQFKKVYVKEGEDNEPYNVGVFRFGENNGLYLIAGYETEESDMFMAELRESLQYSGLGGKRSAGYGRFTFARSDLKRRRNLGCEGKRYISISGCMAKQDELDKALEGASYKLLKRSGFVQSASYAEKQLKKHDFYVFAPGAVFENRFEGDVFDVSIHGAHPVYRYAKPMFIGTDIL